jgi:hypothetical protein
MPQYKTKWTYSESQLTISKPKSRTQMLGQASRLSYLARDWAVLCVASGAFRLVEQGAGQKLQCQEGNAV